MSWDGVQWQSVGERFNNILYALGIFDGELIAGGNFAGASNGADYIAAWNGKDWHALGGGLSGIGADVRALTVYNGELIAAGAFTGADGIPAEHIARWDGAAWHSLGANPDAWWFTDLAVYGRDLFVSGGFLVMGDSVSAYWAHWGPTDDFGDVDGDSKVTNGDMSAAFSCLGGPGSADARVALSDQCICVFNCDGDSDVDLFDFAALQNVFEAE